MRVQITISATLVSVVAGVILLLLLFWALRPEPGHGATGVNDPTAGQVFQVAIDMDPTGNPSGSGGLLSPIDSSSASPVGSTHDIDIIVDEIDPSDGMSGFSLNLKFDPTIVTITSKNFNSFMLAGGFEIVPAPIPNTSGNLRIDAFWIGGNVSGEGVLVRFGVQCIANGTSPLDLADDIGGDGIPDILDGFNFGAPLNVLNAVDGQIVCTGTPTPTPPPTPTPTPPPTPTPTPSPTPTLLPSSSPVEFHAHYACRQKTTGELRDTGVDSSQAQVGCVRGWEVIQILVKH